MLVIEYSRQRDALPFCMIDAIEAISIVIGNIFQDDKISIMMMMMMMMYSIQNNQYGSGGNINQKR